MASTAQYRGVVVGDARAVDRDARVRVGQNLRNSSERVATDLRKR